MADLKTHRKRIKVRVENPAAACGYVDHMTVDELRKQITGDDITLACPSCGLVHLSRLEIEDLKAKKIINSKYYQEMKSAAEAENSEE